MKKIGDIYINPIMGDLWILNKIWNEEKEKDVWTLNLIHYDLQEELENVKGFERIGNIYDLIKENQKLKEQLQQKEDIINKTKRTINQMLNNGYSKGNTFYYATKDGEFGARAEILLEILDNKGE